MDDMGMIPPYTPTTVGAVGSGTAVAVGAGEVAVGTGEVAVGAGVVGVGMGVSPGRGP